MTQSHDNSKGLKLLPWCCAFVPDGMNKEMLLSVTRVPQPFAVFTAIATQMVIHGNNRALFLLMVWSSYARPNQLLPLQTPFLLKLGPASDSLVCFVEPDRGNQCRSGSRMAVPLAHKAKGVNTGMAVHTSGVRPGIFSSLSNLEDPRGAFQNSTFRSFVGQSSQRAELGRNQKKRSVESRRVSDTVPKTIAERRVPRPRSPVRGHFDQFHVAQVHHQLVSHPLWMNGRLAKGANVC